MPTYVRFFANYAKYAIVKLRAWPKQKAVDLRYVQGPCTGELFKTRIYEFRFFTLATLSHAHADHTVWSREGYIIDNEALLSMATCTPAPKEGLLPVNC